MNDRIRELAEEATHQGNTTHYLDIPQWYLEKFAEMIVKECSQMVQNSHPHDLPFVGGKMLVHFGVED